MTAHARLHPTEEHQFDIDWPTLVHTRLHYGRDRAVKIGDLAESMGIHRRIIEASVEELRRTGAPIITGTEGVWLSSDPTEILDAYRRLRSRAIRQLQNARPLLRTARYYERNKQMTLGFPS